MAILAKLTPQASCRRQAADEKTWPRGMGRDAEVAWRWSCQLSEVRDCG